MCLASAIGIDCVQNARLQNGKVSSSCEVQIGDVGVLDKPRGTRRDEAVDLKRANGGLVDGDSIEWQACCDIDSERIGLNTLDSNET